MKTNELKNIFDLNVGGENQVLDGHVFCTQKISKELIESSQTLQRELQNMQTQSRVPLIVSIVQVVCILVAVLSLGKVLDYKGNLLTYLIENPLIWIVFILSASAALAIFIWQRNKTKQFQANIETNDINAKADDIHARMREELQIPLDVREVDILRHVYEMKKGKRKILGGDKTQFENVPTLSYKREHCICFVIDGVEISIPIQKIVKIEMKKKKISIMNWTKETSFTKEPYKKYKITPTDFGAYWLPEYYTISVENSFETYQFLLPSYEETFVQWMEDLKIEE